MIDLTLPAFSPHEDAIRRTTPPVTTNGTQWEVQLSGIPPREWVELFKLAGDKLEDTGQRLKMKGGPAAIRTAEKPL